MNIFQFSIRVIVACFLGILIGFERQYRHRMAGIRTNVLVCVGACLFVMFSTLDNGADKARIAAQVVSGIGFLGGGVIIREGFNIKGLNTAATLWCTAAIGVLLSEGFIYEAIIGTSIILFVNVVLLPLEQKIYKGNITEIEGESHYDINVQCLNKEELHIRALLMHMVKEENIMLSKLESKNVELSEVVNIRAELISMVKKDTCLEKIVSNISLEAGVIAISWGIK
ncbi:putative Mg2+ transporter-C (MgtC) family protein [Clostridium cavendishii DSM 21758]|uniref:Putative Mg2+ transporter-C (MgtC) family protein n=1 Tax=Clostridium cavendishii DSM 21758 TaxID=1121302 RepID=A0A1M6I006_9CLOT|nr:MgtC/SapB family protein [Clostridium cavendishii]SHJ27806.1 putative Mg2+ transporter-C (MgtC) family protein [Clostridium cavendishii DSM 21758]